MPEELCPICEGAGLRVVERPDGTRVAQPCECRIARRSSRMIEQARIPQRYAHCTLDNFVPMHAGKNKSLTGALLQSRGFAKGFPLETDGKGLMFVGPIGVGKTHLAVGLLRSLITERGANGLFYDYRDLLKKIQDSYGRRDVSERQVLGPVFDAEVLVLDELGAAKPTEWVWDTVQHILNTRYNDRRTTIITTNYPNDIETPFGEWEGLAEDKWKARMAMHKDTLGDRITERMRSRLQEMCVVVNMQGADYRQSTGRAEFRPDVERKRDWSLTAKDPASEEPCREGDDAGKQTAKRSIGGAANIAGNDRATRPPNDKDEVLGARAIAQFVRPRRALNDVPLPATHFSFPPEDDPQRNDNE